MGDGEREAVLAACTARDERDLADLYTLIRQPSISAQNIGVRECADLFVDVLREAGFDARLMPTPAHPIVYAEWLGAPGKPTVLIYGHYDVQPPEPLDQWLSPPFEPTVRDGKLFAAAPGTTRAKYLPRLPRLAPGWRWRAACRSTSNS